MRATIPIGAAIALTIHITLSESTAAVWPEERADMADFCRLRSFLAASTHAAVMLTSAQSARLAAHASSESATGSPPRHPAKRVGEPFRTDRIRTVTTEKWNRQYIVAG